MDVNLKSRIVLLQCVLQFSLLKTFTFDISFGTIRGLLSRQKTAIVVLSTVCLPYLHILLFNVESLSASVVVQGEKDTQNIHMVKSEPISIGNHLRRQRLNVSCRF